MHLFETDWDPYSNESLQLHVKVLLRKVLITYKLSEYFRKIKISSYKENESTMLRILTVFSTWGRNVSLHIPEPYCKI